MILFTTSTFWMAENKTKKCGWIILKTYLNYGTFMCPVLNLLSLQYTTSKKGHFCKKKMECLVTLHYVIFYNGLKLLHTLCVCHHMLRAVLYLFILFVSTVCSAQDIDNLVFVVPPIKCVAEGNVETSMILPFIGCSPLLVFSLNQSLS